MKTDNLSINNDLISREVLNQTEQYEKKLHHSIQTSTRFLDSLLEISQQLSGQAKSYRQVMDLIDRYNSLEKEIIQLQKEQVTILEKSASLKAQSLQTDSKQVKQAVAVIHTLESLIAFHSDSNKNRKKENKRSLIRLLKRSFFYAIDICKQWINGQKRLTSVSEHAKAKALFYQLVEINSKIAELESEKEKTEKPIPIQKEISKLKREATTLQNQIDIHHLYINPTSNHIHKI